MTWTYDISQLQTNQLFQLRYLIGDTVTLDQQIQDEELTFCLGQRTNIYSAASDACRSLSSRLSREADTSQGPARTSYSARARNYAARAGQYEVMGMARSAGLPYSGQTSRADYKAVIANADRIGGQFKIGMDDNFLPVGPVNQENDA